MGTISRRSEQAFLGFVALALVAGLMPWLDLPRKHPVTLIAFILLIAVGESLQVALPWGVSVTMGLAPAVGFMLATTCPSAHAAASLCTTSGNNPATVAAVFAAGALIALGIRIVRKKDTRFRALATQAITVVIASAVYITLAGMDPFDAFGPANISYFGIVGVFFTTVALDALIPSIGTAATDRLPLLPLLRGRLNESGALQVASVSVGALLALAHPALGNWSFPLFLVPLVATRYSFRQFASIRKTYYQTIRALARVPEMAGYTVPGHSGRVAALAVEIAQELGVEAGKLEEIQYAALLHDIGRVALPDPSAAEDSTYKLELALVGAQIVEETGYLPGVAKIIGQQYEPYRRRGEDLNHDLQLGAKIVKVASAYDELLHPNDKGRTPWDALERLHLGMAYDYDPAVIQGLTRVLEKRGELVEKRSAESVTN